MIFRNGLLADAIATTERGKKNLLGIFDNIAAVEFPAIHPSMMIYMQLAGDEKDVGPHKIMMNFVDGDYKVIHSSPPVEIQISDPNHSPMPLALTFEVEVHIQNLKIPAEGIYEFWVMDNGRHIGSIPFRALTASHG